MKHRKLHIVVICLIFGSQEHFPYSTQDANNINILPISCSAFDLSFYCVLIDVRADLNGMELSNRIHRLCHRCARVGLTITNSVFAATISVVVSKPQVRYSFFRQHLRVKLDHGKTLLLFIH